MAQIGALPSCLLQEYAAVTHGTGGNTKLPTFFACDAFTGVAAQSAERILYLSGWPNSHRQPRRGRLVFH